jgi:hypothetical protein
MYIFVRFVMIFGTPATGVGAGEALLRRRRRPTWLLSYPSSLKRVRWIDPTTRDDPANGTVRSHLNEI